MERTQLFYKNKMYDLRIRSYNGIINQTQHDCTISWKMYFKKINKKSFSINVKQSIFFLWMIAF